VYGLYSNTISGQYEAVYGVKAVKSIRGIPPILSGDGFGGLVSMATSAEPHTTAYGLVATNFREGSY